VRLRRVARFAYGDSLAERDDGDIAVYGSNGCVGSHAVPNTTGPVLVVGRKGSFGKVQYSEAPVFAIDTTFFVDARHTDANLRWLYYVLLTLRLDDLSGDVGVPGLSREKAYEQRISLPSATQQAAIAAYLDRETARIDALITAKRRMVELLEERDQVELSNLVVPENCQTARLRHFATVHGGITVDASRDAGADAVSRPYLRVANVQAGRLDLAEVTEITLPISLAARATLRKGDVLMTEGGDIDKLGRGTVWEGELEDCLHQNHIFAVRPDPLQLDSWYLSLVTQSDHARAYFESTGVQSTNLASTSSSKILDLPIPVLPALVQREVVVQWNRRSTRTAEMRSALTRQIALIGERRQALITAAVTGQLDIPEAA
jgi:type I restriction enzyme S subunit